MKAKAAKKLSLPKELDPLFFNLVLGKVKNRVAALKVVNQNLITTQTLLNHFQGLRKNKLSEIDLWFSYFDFLRHGLHDLHREEIKLLIREDLNNFREAISESKEKSETGVRLPPMLDQICVLLDPYKNHLELYRKPKEGLEILYWILESYSIAVNQLTPSTFRLEPLLILEKLPILLFSDWREINKWFETTPKLTEQEVNQRNSC